MSYPNLRKIAERQHRNALRDLALVGALAAFVAVQAVSLFGANPPATEARSHASATEALTSPAQPAEKVEPTHEESCVAYEDALC